jgi:hypothetical protein
MVAIKKNLRVFGWIIGALLLVLIVGYIYSTFFKQTASTNTTGMLVIGLLLGAAIMFLVWRLTGKQKEKVVRESSHTIVESMRKVFKIVFAEGHFNELYDFEETKKLFGFIPSTKRALVIIHAKVLVGYDFEKCVWETDEANQKVRLVSFPSRRSSALSPITGITTLTKTSLTCWAAKTLPAYRPTEKSRWKKQPSKAICPR